MDIHDLARGAIQRPADLEQRAVPVLGGGFRINPGDSVEARTFVGSNQFLPALNDIFRVPGFENGFEFQIVHSGIVPVTAQANGAQSRIALAQPAPGGAVAAQQPPQFGITFTIFAVLHNPPEVAPAPSLEAQPEANPQAPNLTIVE